MIITLELSDRDVGSLLTALRCAFSEHSQCWAWREIEVKIARQRAAQKGAAK